MSSDNSKSMNAADTSRRVAAIRAVASEASSNSYYDPLAKRLAGEEHYQFISKIATDLAMNQVDTVVCRAMMIDKMLEKYFMDKVLQHQVVILGSGMDTRCYRLSFPNTTWYEVDQQEVIDYKEKSLKDVTDIPNGKVERIPLDLATQLEDLIPTLKARGFQPNLPTTYLLEGVVYYIPIDAITKLLETLATASGPLTKVICTSIDRELRACIPAEGCKLPKSMFDNVRHLWKSDIEELQSNLGPWKMITEPIPVSSDGASDMKLGLTTKANSFLGKEYVLELELNNTGINRLGAIRLVLLFVAVIAWACQHPMASFSWGTNRFWTSPQLNVDTLNKAL